MPKSIIIIPNLFLMLLAMLLYGRALAGGQVTRVGLLLIGASLLPIVTCFIRWGLTPLRILTALVNIVLAFMSSRVFYGTSYLLIKNNRARLTAYILIILAAGLVIAATIGRKTSRRTSFYSFIKSKLSGWALAIFIQSMGSGVERLRSGFYHADKLSEHI